MAKTKRKCDWPSLVPFKNCCGKRWRAMVYNVQGNLPFGVCTLRLADMLPPPSLPPQTGITYVDRRFSEPTFLHACVLPMLAGVYVILVYDAGYSPRPYRLLYVGESENLNERVSTNHEKYSAWCREAQNQMLYVAYHLTGMNRVERYTLEAAVIREYNPPCNKASGKFVL
jgi:hypothetical protein